MAAVWRRSRVLGAALAVAGLVFVGGCAEEEPPLPRMRMVEFTAEASGIDGAAASGRYRIVGTFQEYGFSTFQQVPFSMTIPVPYQPDPKMEVTLVDVPLGTELTCRITVDGETVAEDSVPAPGGTAVCGGA